MRRIARISPVAWMVAATLAAVTGTAAAQARISPEEVRLQAGSSPVGQEEMVQKIDPRSPPMTKAEFDKAR